MTHVNTSVNTPPGARPTETAATVLCVDDDPEFLSLIERTLGDATDLEILVETDPTAVRDHLDDVDCLVSAYQLGEYDATHLLGSIRDTAADLPILLHSTIPFETIPDELLVDEWTDFLQKDADDPRIELLGHRVRQLVDRQALETVASRSQAALETSREATLLVAPDGTVTFANSRLATELSASPEALRGRPWEELLTDSAVERLRTEAFPVAADGWSWTGPTTLATDEGTVCRTTLSRLDDGSTVLVFHDTNRPDGDAT